MREGSLLLQGQTTLKEYNGNFRSNCTEGDKLEGGNQGWDNLIF